MQNKKNTYPWKIEYEIPPLRAVHQAFADGDYSEKEAKEKFRKVMPEGRIRSMQRMDHWLEQLNYKLIS